MVNLNKVLLIGNLTRDPELRYTPQGTAVVTLRLAVNTMFRDKNRELKQDTCFINVVVWGQMAEVSNQYLSKGRPVLIEGRLISRQWQNSEGKQRSTIEVRASRVQFLPSSSGGSNSNNNNNNRERYQQETDLGQEPKEEIVKLDDQQLEEEMEQ